MEIKIVDQKLEARFQEILRRIGRLQSGGTIDSLKDIGANTDKQIGASYLSLKQLADHYQPNESIALLLWNTHRREEQIIACLLFPENINKEKITQLSIHCLNFEIAGYLGALYLFHYPFLAEVAASWLDSDVPFQQLAVLTALARHRIINKENSKVSADFFYKAVHRNYKDKYVQLAAERYRFNI